MLNVSRESAKSSVVAMRRLGDGETGGQADTGTRGRGDAETGGHGDTGTRGRGDDSIMRDSVAAPFVL